MNAAPAILVDVDNTLLDNDRVQADLGDRLEAELGVEARELYWKSYDRLRDQHGYTDYLGALRQLAEAGLNAGRVEATRQYLLAYPFADRLYPGALEVLAYLSGWALPVIVTDGDPAYQRNKIRRAGLWDAVEGRVLIYVHKEEMLDDIEGRFPAPKYAMVDDKLRILAAMKTRRGERITTVFVRQGHYAFDKAAVAGYAPADLTIENIGGLASAGLPALLGVQPP